MSELRTNKIYSKAEELFSAISHTVGIVLSFVGMIALLIRADRNIEYVAVIIYSISSILLYTMSSLYHFFKQGKVKYLFKRFDHISIYLLIAGTYTPFGLLIEEMQGIMLLIIVWSLAIIGIVFKSIWLRRFAIVHIFLFLGIGWAIVLAPQILFSVPINVLTFLFLGGLSYTLGVLFYSFKFIPLNHGVWHLFVLAGSIFHYFAVYSYLF
jgi:hemolysin III